MVKDIPAPILKGIGSSSEVKVRGKITVSILVAGMKSAPIDVFVVDDTAMNCQILLGHNFLDHFMVIDTVTRALRYAPPNEVICISLKCRKSHYGIHRVKLQETI